MHPHRIMLFPPYWTESRVWSCFISIACLFVRVLRAFVLILFVGRKKQAEFLEKAALAIKKKTAPSHQRSLLFAVSIFKRNASTSAITVSDIFSLLSLQITPHISHSLQLWVLRTPTALGDGEMWLGSDSVRCCSGTFEKLLWLIAQNLRSADKELHISSFSLLSLCLLCFVEKKKKMFFVLHQLSVATKLRIAHTCQNLKGVSAPFMLPLHQTLWQRAHYVEINMQHFVL